MSSNQKVLLFDVETAPLLSYTWGTFDQTVALNQIKSDWHLLSWSAKWLDKGKVFYEDQRNAKDIQNDKKLLKGIWKLLDEADVVITQNGKSFDVKKLNARFILNGMPPPSSFRHIDTYRLAKKHFGFTSNKLEYMTDKLNTKYKKQKHKKFGGFELWKECLAGNMQAWKEMERYNKYDVLSLEELYKKLQPWDQVIKIYQNVDKCNCGSSNFKRWGYRFTNVGKFQRYKCADCGAEHTGKENLLKVNK